MRAFVESPSGNIISFKGPWDGISPDFEVIGIASDFTGIFVERVFILHVVQSQWNRYGWIFKSDAKKRAQTFKPSANQNAS